MNSDIGMPASSLLRGFSSMRRPPIRVVLPLPGDVVRVRVAVNGGFQWKNGRVIASHPAQLGRRVFDVAINGPLVPTVLQRVSELSVRK